MAESVNGGEMSNADMRNLTSRARLRLTPSSEQASLHVAVRIRPILTKGVRAQEAAQKDIIRVMNDRVVIVLDPDEQKDYLDKVQGRTKEKKYTFDIAFGKDARNSDVYDGTIHELVLGCMKGLNVTVFAYGATGSGKTYTMVGKPEDPGLMVLSLERIFRDRQDLYGDEDFDVTCSYIEVYNEVIYDLLVRNSGPLELREDPSLGVQVAGIKKHMVKSPQEIMALLEQGNTRRKTEATNANATSSRSHAVLEVNIVRKPRNQYKTNVLRGKLSLVDLAGSERAAETNNAGQKLRDGANINRSLLALANCINALGKQGRRGMAYVPYRNSKLTRLLKDGLSGNSKTAMIATVSCSSDQYNHSINTLKYADRAKEIKTHVSQNVGSVESHVSEYQLIIDNLQGEVQDLKEKLRVKEKEAPPLGCLNPVPEEDAQMQWLDNLSSEINENTEERINLQKALFELEDANVCNKCELQHLEQYLQSGQPSEIEAMEARERMQAMLANITENNETGLRYRADIEANENHRRSIQEKINSAMESYSSTSFLQVLSTFRMQAVRLQELQFQMAVRDQVINEQRDVISNLWRLIEGAGLNQQQIQAIALQQGILVEGLSGPDMDGNLSAARDSGDSDADNCTPKQIFRGGGGGSNGGGNSMSLANKSIYGARAKYRYDFWQNYDGIGGVDMDDDNMDQENEPPDPHDVRRPSTSQSDHDMRYNSPEPRRPPAAQGTRRSQEQLSSERRCGKESNVGRYNGKASPAKQVRGRGLSYQQKPPPPGTEGPSSSDVAATEARQRPRHSSGRRGGVVHGRRGGGATGASSATQGGEDDSQDAIGTEWSEPVMGRSAWGEDDKGKPDKPDLFVGSDAARGRDREREAPVGGRLMSQLGRLKARRSASDRYPQSQAQAQAQPSQQALGPSVDLDALRIDGSTAAQPTEGSAFASKARRAQFDRLRSKNKRHPVPAATTE